MTSNVSEAIGELINAIRFRNDSKKGKYSLDTYLDIISQRADEIIEESIQNKLYYITGLCKVSLEDKQLKTDIELYFSNSEGERIQKTFSVEKTTSCFVRETMDLFHEKKVLIYNIDLRKGD